MLQIQFSNRIETLCATLVEEMGAAPASPFSAQQIVVPSSAMRRHLTLAIAARYGVCANVDCVFLAQWLWSQIAKVVRTVAVESPFAATSLQWRIYQLLQVSTWAAFPRLANYLKDPNEVTRLELAGEIAALFEQYITYRQDWTSAWAAGDAIVMPQASSAQVEDQAWQAELWRRITDELGATRDHPASLFLRRLATAEGAATNRLELPETVHVFCLPAIPPLYLAVLTGLARMVDVKLYVLNPCNEYWFEIVDPRRLHALNLRGAASHHETGNRLLAAWGKQTKAHIELLLDRGGDAPLDDAGFDGRFPATMLGHLQRAVFSLTELAPGSIPWDHDDRSIEVHVCHSLTRELEVLQDQLLALFAGSDPPRPDQILIVMPDLDSAGPLIEAVFGNVPDDRRLPYAISGRGRSTVNAAARALLAVLAIVPSRFPASALVDLLQQPLIGRRFGIDAAALRLIEDWLRDSGIRWGLDHAHRDELGLPGSGRFTIMDGLDRLFLGYALPQQISAPTFDRIAAGNAEGAQAQVLGAFASFVEQLTLLQADLRRPRLPAEWLEALSALVDAFLAPLSEDLDDIAEARETLRELQANMARGALSTAVPLAVVRNSLQSLFDDTARGGVATGSITFSSMTSLRNLPFRFVGIIGLDDGAFPAAGRPCEFDLMMAAPRAGDRQRRLDDRNLFLDLLLAARERLYLSYTGRSIRDNSVRPPSVVVAELIETLLPALARVPASPAALAEARRQLIVDHPLQAFAASYFREDDVRRRSFNRELCEALRNQPPDPAPVLQESTDPVAEDEETFGARSAALFFGSPLAAPGNEWRLVSLDQLLNFYRNPCHFLLRQRLGLSLYREADSVTDEEPFVADYFSRQALATRLLPQMMQGLGTEELSRLARAGVEYPPGALGAAALAEEMAALQRFALELRNVTQAARLPALQADLPFVLQGEDWRLAALLTERRGNGLVLHRYDDTRPGDYLAAWLIHLVATAASPTPLETRWISRDGSFILRHCPEARAILERLLALYRRGLREPIHFFPKSAWAYIRSQRDLGKARGAWHANFGDARGEDTHAAYRLALRGVADPLDADFQTCAEIVFGSTSIYLHDPRL